MVFSVFLDPLSFVTISIVLQYMLRSSVVMLGKCLCSLYAESLHLLPLVPRKVPDLLKSGKMIKYLGF